MQRVIGEFSGKYEFLDLPDPDVVLLDGVRWGAFEHPLTPAFWVSQAWLSCNDDARNFRLGSSLVEEVTICLLGGYGIPAEVGLAAAARVLKEIDSAREIPLTRSGLEDLLREPLEVNGRSVRYRFARQRAAYVAAALEDLSAINETALSDVELREALRRLPGIGPKTASWIVRNRRASDEVAILDVHIVRACVMMNVFGRNSDPSRNYFVLERKFLDFCMAACVRASVMDAIMWATMRKISKPLLRHLDYSLPSKQLDLPLFGEALFQESIA
ncbi:8-oxoguanine DNA glycosylase [Methylosinus sp. LW4]|uniref:8-oxoguanine DNA glycosylase n=1 Tax=Methylosinus sp. LW4 TaxID=136993 RepID=UPI0012FA17B3|nr:endonuclease III domain-containing protein [Methylosinus sp. LW4]